MSQILLAIATLPELLQVIQEMGDIEYLSKKEFDGKLRSAEGLLSNGATGTLVSLTANTGKDMYIAKAKINWEVSTGNTELLTLQLRLNGVPIESYRGRADVADSFEYEFVNIGGKVLAGQIIEIVINTSEFNLDVEGVIECFEEDTGSDPTILASSITVDATVAGDTGDLVFLKERILSGNTFDVSGDIDAVNDTIEFIVPNGNTAFLVEAKITMKANPVASADGGAVGTKVVSQDQIVADLLIDTVVKDKVKIGMSTASLTSQANNSGAGSGFGTNAQASFNVKTLSLVGDGIKKIEIKNVLDSGSAFATMSGYLTDT